MVQTPDSDPAINVPPSILREYFNNSELAQRIESGELEPIVMQDRHLTKPDERDQPEPFCTRHQFKRYVDDEGKIILETASYLRPDGTLGASGKPDPKRMLVGNRFWVYGNESDPIPEF